ncbi:MAG: flagellar export chaperone FlgN [Planctomycetota bacterium]|nr:hypothetical protein [Planctomycetota bacterium]MDP6367984.1 flagellar export chaperone FlgN [Planctomycetota bacterium]
MKSERSLINHLEVCVEEDLASQRRLVQLIAQQEAAIVDNDTGALSAATEALEAELRQAPTRSGNRERVLRGLARAWRIHRDSITLASAAERAAEGGERISELRQDLRGATAEVARATRRLAALATMHRNVVREVIDALLGDETSSPVLSAGTLVNAEA